MDRARIAIELAPETVELLRAKAVARHLTLDQYLRALATGEEADAVGPPAMTPRERAARWDEWTTRRAMRIERPADDSREIIYTGENDAL